MSDIKPELYGIAYHSPLVIKPLINPEKYLPLLLLSQNKMDVRREADAKIDAKRTDQDLVVIADSLACLQTFVSEYSNKVGPYKAILVDVPSILLPFECPILEWLDCDLQAGGAWQLTKLKLEEFDEKLEQLEYLSKSGQEFVINKMRRYVPRNKMAEIEEMLSHLPESYKDLFEDPPIDAKDLDKDFGKKDDSWKEHTLKTLISAFLEDVPKNKREEAVYVILGYELRQLTKREFTSSVNKLVEGDETLKKRAQNVRKWLDHKEKGKALYSAYCDYLANLETRSWNTIVETSDISEDDLLMLISFQPRTKEIKKKYEGDLKRAASLTADDESPNEPYHREPTPIKELFNI